MQTGACDADGNCGLKVNLFQEPHVYAFVFQFISFNLVIPMTYFMHRRGKAGRPSESSTTVMLLRAACGWVYFLSALMAIVLIPVASRHSSGSQVIPAPTPKPNGFPRAFGYLVVPS